MPAVVVYQFGEEVTYIFPNTKEGARQAFELRAEAVRAGRFVAWLGAVESESQMPREPRR